MPSQRREPMRRLAPHRAGRALEHLRDLVNAEVVDEPQSEYRALPFGQARESLAQHRAVFDARAVRRGRVNRQLAKSYPRPRTPALRKERVNDDRAHVLVDVAAGTNGRPP